MFKWSRATVTRMNGAATPDNGFLRSTKVPYKVLYALLFTLLVVMIVLLLPNNRATELVAISAVERIDRENTGSSGTGTSIVFRDDSAQVVFNATYPITRPKRVGGEVHFRIGAVADRDENSKLDDVTWGSYLKTGTLTLYTDGTISVKWDKEMVTLKSHISEKGRGVELSELIVFNGKLYTVDDRSGIVYEIRNKKLVPWVIMEDGPGNVDKGFKAEWMTVKDQRLHIGGLGKEWTTQEGKFVNDHPQYIKVINALGHIEHLPWAPVYNKIRQSAGIDPPGYIIHEAVVWSNVHRRWYFLPRRASRDSYNDVEDEHRATNLLITADEEFVDIKVSTLGPLNMFRGFSSFKFLPGSQDSIIVALKSEENKGTIATYMYAFDLNNHVLMKEIKVADTKFEGLEFI